MKPAYIAGAAVGLFVASFGSSFVHPGGNPRSGTDPRAPLLAGSNVPANVAQVLEAKCADCHSERTKWPAYSRFAPTSWVIEHDVQEGREHLNLSRWQDYTLETRVDLLSQIAAETRNEQMPLRQYLVLHPSARLSAGEQQLIYSWAKSERKQIRRQIVDEQTGHSQNMKPGNISRGE